MRSFVVFALLALALCQSPMDIVTGFTNQLALTDAQNADFNTCINGLFGELQGLAPLYMDYAKHDFEALIQDGAMFFSTLESSVTAACEPVLVDLETYAITFGNGYGPKINSEINGAYVAQQVAILVQAVATKNFTLMGQTAGYIFQIVIGSVDLPSLKPAQLTQDQVMTMIQNVQAFQTNQNGELTAFFQGYVNELGLNIDATVLANLYSACQNFTQTIVAFEAAMKTGDFDSDITNIENFVTEVLEFVRINKDGIEAAFSIDMIIIDAFLAHPVQYVASVVYNVLLNAPKIEGFSGQVQQDFITGDFNAVGADTADLITSVYGKIF